MQALVDWNVQKQAFLNCECLFVQEVNVTIETCSGNEIVKNYNTGQTVFVSWELFLYFEILVQNNQISISDSH